MNAIRQNSVDISLSLEKGTIKKLRELQTHFSDASAFFSPVKYFTLPFCRLDSSSVDSDNLETLVTHAVAGISSPCNKEGHFTLKGIEFIKKSRCLLVVVQVYPSQQLLQIRNALMLRLNCELPDHTSHDCAARSWKPYIVIGSIATALDINHPGAFTAIAIRHPERAKSKNIGLPRPGDIFIYEKNK